MPARAKKVATSDMTAATGLRRVMVSSAPATVAPARMAKTITSARLALSRPSDSTRLASCLFLVSGRLPDAGFEIGAELGEEAQHGPCGRLAERADCVAGDAHRDVGQLLDVTGASLAIGDAFADPGQPAGAFPAGGALAAGLV